MKSKAFYIVLTCLIALPIVAMEEAQERAALLSTVLQVGEPQQLTPDLQRRVRLVRDMCKIFYDEKLDKNIGRDGNHFIANILHEDLARWEETQAPEHPLQDTVPAHTAYRTKKTKAKEVLRSRRTVDSRLRESATLDPGSSGDDFEQPTRAIDVADIFSSREDYSLLRKKAIKWITHALAQHDARRSEEVLSAQQRVLAWRKRFGGGALALVVTGIITLVSGYFNIHCGLSGTGSGS